MPVTLLSCGVSIRLSELLIRNIPLRREAQQRQCFCRISQPVTGAGFNCCSPGLTTAGYFGERQTWSWLVIQNVSFHSDGDKKPVPKLLVSVLWNKICSFINVDCFGFYCPPSPQVHSKLKQEGPVGPGTCIICLPHTAHKAAPAKISAFSQKIKAAF